jgi:hypothetical protein
MGRVFSTHGEQTNAYRVLVGKPEGKRRLEKCRRMWEDNIKLHYLDYMNVCYVKIVVLTVL